MTVTQILPWHEQALWLIAIFITSVLVGLSLYFGLKKILIISNPDFADDLNRVKRPFIFVVFVIVFQLWTQFYFDSETPYISQASQILAILAIVSLLIGITKGAKDYVLRKYETDSADNFKFRKLSTQVRLFERIVIVIIVILGLALILMTFESIRRIGFSILTSAGIAGIIIGLAAQKLIANLLAGFQLALTQPIRIDDAVLVENEWGWIDEISLTYVVIRLWDKRSLVVPSTYFIEKPFQNWTRTKSDLMGTVFIHVDYRMPVDPIREEVTRILNNTELWDGKVNVVQVTEATEKSMELRILVSAKNSPTAWDLRVHVREKIIEFLQKNYQGMLPKSRVFLEGEKGSV